MPTKYLYIDDDKTSVITPLINSLESNSNGELELTHTQVLGSISQAIAYITQNQDSFQGIIIDQDLKAISDDGKSADYYGTTLAQQLRTDMAVARVDASRGCLKTMPLVLMSNEEVIIETFEPDDSSKNLFDFVISKKKLANNSVKMRATKMLLALNEAYIAALGVLKASKQELNDQEIQRVLGCDEQCYASIDSRFLDYIKPKASDPHALVGSIYSTLVQSAGMLVTEEMLKTKLGLASDTPQWEQLKVDNLTNYRYRGPFAKVKERWWFEGIENWWHDLYPDDALQSLASYERVEVLKDKLQLQELKEIQPRYPDGEESEYPWVNCVLSGLPLDPYDALRVRDPDAKSWEQEKYLDLLTFRNDTTEKYAIHRDDRSKVRLLQARLKPNANS